LLYNRENAYMFRDVQAALSRNLTPRISHH
jgi:hypothetical protein